MVRYGCVNFEDFLSALGCLEEQVSLSVDAYVEANDDPHLCVEKINGRLYIYDKNPDDVPLVGEPWFLPVDIQLPADLLVQNHQGGRP